MMLPSSLFCFFLLLAATGIGSSSSSTFNFSINVWPKPTRLHWSDPSAFSPLAASFRIHLPRPDALLTPAARRYLRLLLSERHRPLVPPAAPLRHLSPPLSSLLVHLHPRPSPDDESYTLLIPSSGAPANLSSPSPLGALRGLETLSQLAFSAGRRGVLVPSGVEIRDAPLFRHRGVLLDTSRNFYPVRDLRRTIAAMAMNKLNVFHWHITDSHSFPVLLPRARELGEKGSYGEGMRYTPEDVRRIVRFAASRGVRVIPEFDAPGHAASWAKAYPEIVTCADKFWAPPDSPPLAAEPATGQLNPLHPKTYEVYLNVLRDAADLFPDTFLHAGADEVSAACWSADPAVRSFLDAGGTPSQLLEVFVNSTLPFITGALRRTAIYWEDALLGSPARVRHSLLPPDSVVIQTWSNGLGSARKLAAAGYRVVVSSADYYYLDCGHGGWVGNDSRYDAAEGFGGSWCEPFKTWQRVYAFDVREGMGEEEKARVLGGEVALWSEQADGAVVDGRLWPRAAAFAEAMWSGNRDEAGRKRAAEATDRLHEWRHRMVGRGIAAEPIQPLWCVYNPGMCNLVQ